MRDTGQQRQVGLGHTECQLRLRCLAPSRDAFATLQHHAADAAAGLHRAAQAVEGWGVGVVHAPGLLARAWRLHRVARPGGFMGQSKSAAS